MEQKPIQELNRPDLKQRTPTRRRWLQCQQWCSIYQQTAPPGGRKKYLQNTAGTSAKTPHNESTTTFAQFTGVVIYEYTAIAVLKLCIILIFLNKIYLNITLQECLFQFLKQVLEGVKQLPDKCKQVVNLVTKKGLSSHY